jgi:hypothetical protein
MEAIVYHFSEGAIDHAMIEADKTLHALSIPVAGIRRTVLMVSEVNEKDPTALAAERLKEAKLSLRSVRNPAMHAETMGGVPAVSLGWEFFDEAAGNVTAHQILAAHGGRLVSLSATFPASVADKGVEALKQVAHAVRWRRQ